MWRSKEKQFKRALREKNNTEVCGENRGHTGLGRATEINELASRQGAACQMGSLTGPGFERRMAY
jgi:hypothetical protein